MNRLAPTSWQSMRAPLLGFVRKRLPGDAQDAEDLVQEILLRAWRRRHQLRDQDKLQPWLYRIARTALVDHQRRLARLPGSAPLPQEPPAPTPQELSLAHSELSGCVQPFLHLLPPHYQEALELTELQGLPQAEVARRLALPPSTVKSRVQRGRRKLRDLLLECCEIQADCRGEVLDYQPRGRAQRCEPG